MIDWLRRAAPDPVVRLAGADYPVAIIRRAQAKRLILRLAPDGSHVRVSAPPWCPSREALAFVQERTDWLEAQLARHQRPAEITKDSIIPYRGGEISLAWQAGAPRRPMLAPDGALRFGGDEAGIAQRAQRWLRGEAERLMRADIADYTAQMGRAAPRLALSNAQRRWGSCSSTGTVRLNWRLIMAPDAVRRSVAAHECAHLAHFDHSPAFHALLAQIYEGDLKAADRWLKTEGRMLYSYFG